MDAVQPVGSATPTVQCLVATGEFWRDDEHSGIFRVAGLIQMSLCYKDYLYQIVIVTIMNSGRYIETV